MRVEVKHICGHSESYIWPARFAGEKKSAVQILPCPCCRGFEKAIREWKRGRGK